MNIELAKKLPQCTVRGLVAPGGMCGAIIVGGVYCGSKKPCSHKLPIPDENSTQALELQGLQAINTEANPLKIYIAGPMTGLPEFNYPAFHTAAAQLRALGHEVFNPAENPAPACGTWEGYMRLALAQLVQCDAIALLPGWETSRGAKIEASLAADLGMIAKNLGVML